MDFENSTKPMGGFQNQVGYFQISRMGFFEILHIGKYNTFACQNRKQKAGVQDNYIHYHDQES